MCVNLNFTLLCTLNDDRSHEIKRCFSLGRKAMTNLDNILKSRDIILPTKVCIVKATVFPAVTYRCESWTIRKAEHQRTDAFGLWCWSRLLRVLWTTRRSNQPILQEINPLENQVPFYSRGKNTTYFTRLMSMSMKYEYEYVMSMK